MSLRIVIPVSKSDSHLLEGMVDLLAVFTDSID